MSEKQNPRPDKDDSPVLEEEQSGDTSRRNYYYDDSTGYEIYDGESDDDDGTS